MFNAGPACWQGRVPSALNQNTHRQLLCVSYQSWYRHLAYPAGLFSKATLSSINREKVSWSDTKLRVFNCCPQLGSQHLKERKVKLFDS